MPHFFATTAKAMEPLLADELRALGAKNVVETRAGASFEGDIETAYRVCLWTRIANRVLLPLKTFSAPDEAKLYGGVKSIRWTEHIPANGTMAVDFAASESQITHTHYGALKVKDAIVDQIRSIKGERPSVDIGQPDVRVNVYLHRDVATVSIDLSGESLHRRGYREKGVAAPLKENLAAAILATAEWPRIAADGGALLDPMCGSGTLPIEAAMMALDIAPGLKRQYYGFFKWLGHDTKIWWKLMQEAKEREAAGRKKGAPMILGFDRDPRAIRVAEENVGRAGLRDHVKIEKREFERIEAPGPKGLIVMNPPYGERLGEVEELKPLYKSVGDTFKQKFKGWTGYVFTSSPDLAKVIGLKASRRHILFNGALECRLLKFDLYAGSKDAPKNPA